MNMQIRTRLLVGFLASVLFFSFAGGFAFCSGCGNAVMDCCRGDGSTFESISTNPCCQFQMSSAPEPHPATIDSGKLLVDESGSSLAMLVEFPGREPAIAGTRDLSPSPSPPRVASQPLFILNAALLC